MGLGATENDGVAPAMHDIFSILCPYNKLELAVRRQQAKDGHEVAAASLSCACYLSPAHAWRLQRNRAARSAAGQRRPIGMTGAGEPITSRNRRLQEVHGGAGVLPLIRRPLDESSASLTSARARHDGAS